MTDALINSEAQLQSSQEAAKSCWELAVKIFNTTLTNDSNKIIYSGKVNTIGCSLPAVLEAAKDAKDKCGKNSSSFAAKMDALLLIFSGYSITIDIMMQHQPHITALVWGAIRLLISTAVKEIELREEIGCAVVSIAKEIGRWEAYLQLYNASSRIHSTIAELLSQVINFTVRAIQFYEMPRPLRYARCGFAPGEGKLQRILAEIKHISARLERETTLASEEMTALHRKYQGGHFYLQKAEIEEQRAFRKESQKFQEQILGSLTIQQRTLSAAIGIQNLLGSSNLLDCAAAYSSHTRLLNWLKPATSLDVSPAEWEEGTCEWIFTHAAYKKWEAIQYSSPLWIYGIPGCGKSVLANFLSRNARTPPAFTYLCQSSTNRGSTMATLLAASILAQVLEEKTIRKSSHFPQIIQHVIPLVERFSSCDLCPFEQLWPHLEYIFTFLQNFTLLVDALDEWSDTAYLPMFLERLSALSNLPNSRVILISRYIRDYETHLPHLIHLCMDEDTVSSDIMHFICKEIDRTPRLASLRHNIITKVGSDAQGMFLWAKIMIEYLKKASTPRLQRMRLDHFPTRLSAVYEKFIMETGTLLDDDELILRKEIFLLLAAAARPFSVCEISTAIALKSTTSPSHEDMPLDLENEILRLCWPLVMIKDKHVQLIHFSAREFLFLHTKTVAKTNLRVTLESSHRYMAHKCLNQLGQPSFASSQTVVSLLQHNVCPEAETNGQKPPVPKVPTLYEYACLNWHIHVVASSPDENFAIQVSQFLQGKAFVAWVELLFHLKPGADMSSVLSVRAALLSWHSLAQLRVRALIQMSAFFVGPYESALTTPEFSSTDGILPYLLLHRLRLYFNVAAEQRHRRYEITRTIMEGAEAVLGPRHPFTLRGATEFGIEKITHMEFDQSEALLWRVYEIQSEVLDIDVHDSFHTLSNYALTIYYQMKLDESIIFQEQASTGLLRTLGSTNKKYLKSLLYLGWCLEAQGQLDRALVIYENIWKTWATLYSPDDTLAMMAQIGMCTVHRKKRNFKEALKHGSEVFANRQRIFGEGNSITVDTALNLVILYRDSESYDQARAMLDLAISLGGDHQSFHRLCLIERLKACLEMDAGDLETASKILQKILREASENNLPNNREVLWARLSLADLLRSQGKPAEALQNFVGLVDSSIKSEHALEDSVEPETSTSHLEIAEISTRFTMNNDIEGAQRILRSNNLRWRRSEDYWIPVGGPFAGI